MSGSIVHVSDSSFEQDVLQAEGPVLVDFWAEWCGPCKMIAPVLEEISGDYAGKLTVAKMDVDANTATAPKYGVRGIPSLLIFKGGEERLRRNTAYAVFPHCLSLKAVKS